MRGAAALDYTPTGDALRFSFDYNSAMVAALKGQIPSADRRFDWASKTWLVAPRHEDTCIALAARFLGACVRRPQPPLLNSAPSVTELIELRYLGAAKERGGDERTAFGHDGTDWRFIFPEEVLREWFGLDSSAPGGDTTLYAVLGIRRGAAEDEIKRAFRATARQWHPDVCSEPNATQVFQRINEAYQVLSDPSMRARYDAGLALESSLGASVPVSSVWRPPLRCGYLLVNATPQLGRLLVTEILQWTEIIRGGKTLVTSWQFGDDTYTEKWV